MCIPLRTAVPWRTEAAIPGDDRHLKRPDSAGAAASHPTGDPAEVARRKFVASLISSARTRDMLAVHRDKTAAARDLAVVLQELGGHATVTPAEARSFAAHDRQASRDDRNAAATDRLAAQASLLVATETDDYPEIN